MPMMSVRILRMIRLRDAVAADDECDAHLLAVAAVVARVAALSLIVALRLALEVGRGYVVEQQVVIEIEHLPQPLFQENLEGVLVRQQSVQRAIQPVVVDLVGRHAQKVGDGAVAVEMFGDMQLARGLAQSAEHQHGRHHRPRDIFAAAGDRVGEKLVEAQKLHQLQTQPRPAELSAAFDAHAVDVDFRIGRLDVAEELALTITRSCGRLADAFASSLVALAHVGDNALARAALGAV